MCVFMKKSSLYSILALAIAAFLLSQSLATPLNTAHTVQKQGVGTVLQTVSSTNQINSTLPSGSAVQNYTSGASGQQNGTYDASGFKVPSRYVYLPNTHPLMQNLSTYQSQLYTASPAPMGIADYGVYNNSGNIESYSYSTTSFEGTASISNLSPLYVLNGAPQSLSLQLNAILKNVTLGGNSSYVFWNQNVVLYSARTHQIQLIDNIWNFSSPGAAMTNSTLSGYNGTLVPNSLYYDVGPLINVTYPFTVSLYLNSTLDRGSNVIFFNYSVRNGGVGGKTVSGSYDNVTFNSSSALKSPAGYYVSGSKNTPLGFLPYDAEFVIGGPGGGSTTSLYGVNATMSLSYLNSTSGSYSNVRAAYDAGSDTGETASGISVSWNKKDQAILTAGPSIIYGMWGISNSGMSTFSGKISPAGSFLFVNGGASFDNNTSSWVPLATDGTFNFTLAAGTYSAAIFSSWHNPLYSSLQGINGSNSVLARNSSMGIYTPLYVFGNNQLSQVATAGSGTAADPYLVTGIQNRSILPVFGRFNDFAFPVFSGILVSGTTDHAYFSGLPSFRIQYPYYEQNFLNFNGLPTFNYMNMEFYNDSNLALLNGSFLSGWFSSNLAAYFPAASVVFWNTTNSLVSSNYFSSMDLSLFIYNYNATDSNITVWGNEFAQNGLVQSTVFNSINVAGAPTGLMLYSSGNLIYNNIFDVYQTAVSPGTDFYTGNPVNYTDQWNISREPLAFYSMVLGKNLTGGIMESGPNGIKYQAGNYWWNYLGNGSQIYNNSGLISYGGDMDPLVHHVYGITFSQTGLPAGTEWFIIINNGSIAVPGSGSSITFYEPNGSYFIEIYTAAYLANQSSGFVIVSGSPQQFNITFSRLYYLAFIESGLPSGTTWSITVNGVTGTASTDTIAYLATNGSYQYSLGSVNGYYPLSSTGFFSLAGANTTVSITFFPVAFPVSFSETGLPTGTLWGIFIGGQKYMGASSTLSVNLPNGTYGYTLLGVLGYTSPDQYGTVHVQNGSASVQVTFQVQKLILTFTESGLPAGSSWSVTIGGQTFSSTNGSIILQGSTGEYNYTISGPSGYVPSHTRGTVMLNSNLSVPVSFSRAGGLSLFQIVDYALFAGSAALLAFAVYTVRKKP